MNTEQAINHLRMGKKIKASDWGDGEYIQYFPDKGVVTENGEEVNAMVFIVNPEWKLAK